MELVNGVFACTILMDLSKAYDCLPHELLIAKLKCHGIENKSLRLWLHYITNRKQRAKIGSSFSSWCHYTDLPQGYFPMHSLLASLTMPLWYGFLLGKHW